MRVIHIISSADAGGAEIMLAGLVEAHARPGVESHIVVLGSRGVLSERLAACASSVDYLGVKRGARPSLRHGISLRRLTRQISPSVVHGWMPHGMAAAWLARFFAPRRCVLIWGVHQSLSAPEGEAPLTLMIIRFLAKVSNRVNAIAYVSNASRYHHEALGFSPVRGTIIDNAVDSVRFSPNEALRREKRVSMGIPESADVVGYIGRHHPQKDIKTLFAALNQVVRSSPGVHAVILGAGLEGDAVGELVDAECKDRMHCLGRRGDVAEIIRVFDVLALSSIDEAAPTVILEAMACGIPSVVTDVGDSARLAGAEGIAVPPRDAVALADAVSKLLSSPRDLRAQRAAALRARAIDEFSIDRMSNAYLGIYASAAAKPC